MLIEEYRVGVAIVLLAAAALDCTAVVSSTCIAEVSSSAFENDGIVGAKNGGACTGGEGEVKSNDISC